MALGALTAISSAVGGRRPSVNSAPFDFSLSLRAISVSRTQGHGGVHGCRQVREHADVVDDQRDFRRLGRQSLEIGQFLRVPTLHIVVCDACLLLELVEQRLEFLYDQFCLYNVLVQESAFGPRQ